MPYGNPTITTPVTFRQSATDADNHLRTNVAAIYVQDQIELSPHVQLRRRAALRPLRSRRTTTTATATRWAASTTSSRRAPASSSSRSRRVSIYGSYSVSYLPELRRPVLVADHRSRSRSKPEKFTNYEVGREMGRAAARSR